MASIVLGWTDFKVYEAEIGPGRESPNRPEQCQFCDGAKVWFDGWRRVCCVVIDDGGESHGFEDRLFLRRCCCALPLCGRSWTLRPAFLYPHRHLEPDVAEASALAYLSAPGASYRWIGETYGCSGRTVWRWVGWLAGIISMSALLAEAEQLSGTGQSAALIPAAVPQDHPKAHSAERAMLLLCSLQGLVALAVWARAQPLPPCDPSPLRFWLTEQFRTLRKIHRLGPGHLSPPLPRYSTGPPTL